MDRRKMFMMYPFFFAVVDREAETIGPLAA